MPSPAILLWCFYICSNDYGQRQEFFNFKGKCFELEAGGYTYKVCPYDGAKQGFTSLGDWEGLTEENTVMEFSGGQSCWNAGDRSLRCDPVQRRLPLLFC
jgi:protein kinase C substrate 80K-H